MSFRDEELWTAWVCPVGVASAGDAGGDSDVKRLTDSIFLHSHGHPVMMFDRTQFIKLLYDSLPNRKQHVLTGKAVQSLSQDSDGVTVTCTDGSGFRGDILVGADGVHSTVRRLISPELSKRHVGDVNGPEMIEAGPFVATYQCLFGTSTGLSGRLQSDSMIEVHDRGVSWHLLTLGEDRVAWFLFVHRGKKGLIARRGNRYAVADAEELAARYAAHPVWKDGKVTFRDLWKTRLPGSGKVVDLEEGILERRFWSRDRVVLLGDAVHKMTPNISLGANNAIESTVILTNMLHAMYENAARVPKKVEAEVAESRSTHLSMVREAFEGYANQRYDRAKMCVELSGLYTRFGAWDNWGYEVLGRYLAPLVGERLPVSWLFSPIAKGGAVLDFIEESDRQEGRIRWDHEGKVAEPP